jgi:hypothetical protein
MTPRSHLLPPPPIHILKPISKRSKEGRSGTERRRRPRRIIRQGRRDERRGRRVDIVIVLRKGMGMTGRIVARVIMFVFVNLYAIVDVAHDAVLDMVIEEIMACVVVVAVMVTVVGIRIAAGHHVVVVVVVVAVMTVTVARVQCTVLLL